MTTRQTSEILSARNELAAPPAPAACNDQSFELPNGIYAAMALMFAGFIGILSLSFRGGHMGVAYGVIFAFIAMFFAVPAAFPGMAASKKSLSWTAFRLRGIQTATGKSSAREATVLVLLLPFLVLCFGLAVSVISSVVR